MFCERKPLKKEMDVSTGEVAKMIGNLINKFLEKNKDKSEEGIFEGLGLPGNNYRYLAIAV